MTYPNHFYFAKDIESNPQIQEAIDKRNNALIKYSKRKSFLNYVKLVKKEKIMRNLTAKIKLYTLDDKFRFIKDYENRKIAELFKAQNNAELNR